MNSESDVVRTHRTVRADSRQIRGAESPRRVLQVLLAFDEERPAATISELADIVGVPLSTCYRYVGLLREVGLIEEGERATYHVTPQIMRVARAAQVSNKLSQIARPYLEQISGQVNETVMLMQLFGTNVVCVESIAATRSIRLVFESGHSTPLGSGASGRLMLAYLPASEQATYLAARTQREPAFGELIPQLERDLPQLARQGWATGTDEHTEGVWACAAAIRLGGRAVATVSAAGPGFRIAPEKRDEIRQLLLGAAAEIAEASGGYR
jgi:DNA-binding IclR family transcriptional regulator